ncbi:MAG: DUF4157 domain-containing protein, partial [Nitrospiraceae bacterium]
FGHDFSRVRLHADASAHATADALAARAFTLGSDVVFASGEYAPHSPAGRYLLAHELTHVVQQGAAPRLAPGAYSIRVLSEGGEHCIGPPTLSMTGPAAAGEAGLEPTHGAPFQDEQNTLQASRIQRMPRDARSWIQRVASFTNPVPKADDPLVRLGKGLTPGLTTPTINGNVIANLEGVLNAISPTEVKQTRSSGGNVQCQFTNFTINTSCNMIVATAAPAGGWSAAIPPASIGNPAACAKKAKIPVTMNALPSNADFVKRVQVSEDEHRDDIRTLHNRHLAPYDTFITGLTGSGADLNGCGQNLVAQVNKRHTQAAYGLVYGYQAAARRLDGPGGTHRDTAVPTIAPNCASVALELSQSAPRKPKSGPGNVVPVNPTVTAFNPTTAKVVGNEIRDGKTVVKQFSTAADAKAALAVIQHYGMDSRNVIGPFEYYLVGKAAPSGALKGANELAIDPAYYQVTFNLPSAGDWAITDVLGNKINVFVNFGVQRDEAYSAWAVMLAYRFTHIGWVGGTKQKRDMMYFRV